MKEVKGKPDKINELMLKTKADLKEGPDNINSHLWIMFYFNWMVVIWKELVSIYLPPCKYIKVSVFTSVIYYKIQRADNMKELRRRESFWQYKLNTFFPPVLNERKVPVA